MKERISRGSHEFFCVIHALQIIFWNTFATIKALKEVHNISSNTRIFQNKNVMHINKGSLEIPNFCCDNEISKHTFSKSLGLWNNTAFQSQHTDTVQYTTISTHTHSPVHYKLPSKYLCSTLHTINITIQIRFQMPLELEVGNQRP